MNRSIKYVAYNKMCVSAFSLPIPLPVTNTSKKIKLLPTTEIHLIARWVVQSTQNSVVVQPFELFYFLKLYKSNFQNH